MPCFPGGQGVRVYMSCTGLLQALLVSDELVSLAFNCTISDIFLTNEQRTGLPAENVSLSS